MTKPCATPKKKTPSSVEPLIDPADKQNIPKAVTLIQSINLLKLLDVSHHNPPQINEHRSLVVIGKIFSSFMDPFTTVTMSLSEQLILLLKYAHAAFAIYSKHSTNSMTSALYADSQAIVKDVYFCVAKQKLLDPWPRVLVQSHGAQIRDRRILVNLAFRAHDATYDRLWPL